MVFHLTLQGPGRWIPRPDGNCQRKPGPCKFNIARFIGLRGKHGLGYGCKYSQFLRSIYKNKTQYEWFPGKSQNSKKFSAKFKQNPTTSKNHRVFLKILGGYNTPRRSQQILGVKITSKMNSQHRPNTQCANFQQNLTTFKKSLS